MTNPYVYSAELVRVIDGDTCVLNVDLGFKIHFEIRGRLKGINCPEMSTPEGPTAKAFAEQWFKDAMLLTIKSFGADKYARWDVEIYGISSKESLNEALLRTGNAKVMK